MDPRQQRSSIYAAAAAAASSGTDPAHDRSRGPYGTDGNVATQIVGAPLGVATDPNSFDALSFESQFRALAATRPDLLPLLVPRPPPASVLQLAGASSEGLAAAAAAAANALPHHMGALDRHSALSMATPGAAPVPAQQQPRRRGQNSRKKQRSGGNASSSRGHGASNGNAGHDPSGQTLNGAAQTPIAAAPNSVTRGAGGMNRNSTTDAPLSVPPPDFPMPSMDNVQLSEIPNPFIHPHDVLCGRGGGTNNHAGNEKFRELVSQQKVAYLHSSKRDKPFVSRGIVRAVRAQNPPGRFLQKDERTGLWYDIGDQKAREKTSQALREGAPEIRREITSSWVKAPPTTAAVSRQPPTVITANGYPTSLPAPAPAVTGPSPARQMQLTPTSAVPTTNHMVTGGSGRTSTPAAAPTGAGATMHQRYSNNVRGTGSSPNGMGYFPNVSAMTAAGMHPTHASAVAAAANAGIPGASHTYVDHTRTMRLATESTPGGPNQTADAGVSLHRTANGPGPSNRVSHNAKMKAGAVNQDAQQNSSTLDPRTGSGAPGTKMGSMDVAPSPYSHLNLAALRDQSQNLLDPARVSRWILLLMMTLTRVMTKLQLLFPTINERSTWRTNTLFR